MAPTKKSPSTSKGATRTPTKATRKASAKKSAAKRGSASAPKQAAAAAKKAVEPVTRAANAAKRTASKQTKTGKARRTASSDGHQQPDAIRVLTDDHRDVEELFVRFEKTGEGAHKRRSDLVERITEALSIHASIEEEIFYPAARDRSPRPVMRCWRRWRSTTW